MKAELYELLIQRIRTPAGNKRLVKWRVKWLIEHSTSHQPLWCIDSLVLRNPSLRQALNVMPYTKRPMLTDRFTENIDKQIGFNQGKNIFLDNLEIFQFANETVKAISNIDKLTPHSKEYLIDYAKDKAIEEFCRVNQYYSFDLKAKNNLRQIYSNLFEALQTRAYSIDNISKEHYEKLKFWIKENNPFAEKLYKDDNENISPVVCSEYTGLANLIETKS